MRKESKAGLNPIAIVVINKYTRNEINDNPIFFISTSSPFCLAPAFLAGYLIIFGYADFKELFICNRGITRLKTEIPTFITY